MPNRCRTCDREILNSRVGHPAEYCTPECRRVYRNLYSRLKMRIWRDKMKGRIWKVAHGSNGTSQNGSGYYDDNGEFVTDDKGEFVTDDW